MKTNNTKLSVVVALYNEEAVVENNINLIVHALNSHSDLKWELVCVNDGSKDQTGDLLEAIRKQHHASAISIYHHSSNFGQGRALRTGFEHCKGDVIITMDADMSYGVEYIMILFDAIQKHSADIVLTSPYAKGGSVKNVPPMRRFLSKMGNYYLSRMIHYPISTCTSVVRAYKRHVIDDLILTTDGMELQIETLMKSSIMGYKVYEIPACLHWHKSNKAIRKERVSKMRLLHTIKLYLLMGWLAKPATFFIGLAFLLLLSGLYLGLNIITIFGRLLSEHINEGVVTGISKSMQSLVSVYNYGLFFCATFLLFGFLILVFSLLFIQNKFYYEEFYKMLQQIKVDAKTRNED